MSLQVWLPLNGNLNNQGLSNIAVTNNGATIDNNGKIGKCYKFDGSSSINTNYDWNPDNVFSVSVWIYRDGAGGTVIRNSTKYSPVIDFGGSNSNMRVFFWYSTSSYIMLPEYSITMNIWTHVVITKNESSFSLYVNGLLVRTVETSEKCYNTGFLQIGYCNTIPTFFNGKLNDLRIYDHCLSPLEVKQISQGLVCHYQLKSQYETGQVNKYSGDVAEGSLIANQFTKTKLEGERGYNYKLSHTGSGGNMWASMNAGYFSFTVGKKYYYSCKVRCHSKNFNMALRASRSDNDWVTNMTYVLNPDGEWHEYVVSQTINSTYDRSGSTVTCCPVLEFYTESLVTSGTVYSADFDIKDIQVIESDCYVPFIDNDMVSNVVSDCSGYGNNGTAKGVITWNGDSPRYSGCYFFNVSGIYKDNINLTLSDFTISYWLKRDSTTGYNKMFFGSNSSSSVNTAWYHYGDNSFKFPLGEFYYNHNAGSEGDLLNQWVLFTFVYDGSTLKVYRNSVYEGSKSFSGNVLLSNLSVGIGYDDSGFWGHASMSDFRIYSTALSEEDVKALYSISASIDKTGVLSAYEFVEEG